jgi:hypothetical protein
MPDVVEEHPLLCPGVFANEELSQLARVVGPCHDIVGEASVPTAIVERCLLLNPLGQEVKRTTV